MQIFSRRANENTLLSLQCCQIPRTRGPGSPVSGRGWRSEGDCCGLGASRRLRHRSTPVHESHIHFSAGSTRSAKYGSPHAAIALAPRRGSRDDRVTSMPRVAMNRSTDSSRSERDENGLTPPWLEDSATGRRIKLATRNGDLTIGRDHSCDVPLHAHGVSNHHATLTHRQASWWIKDSQSTNGTYVNDRRIDFPPRSATAPH